MLETAGTSPCWAASGAASLLSSKPHAPQWVVPGGFCSPHREHLCESDKMTLIAVSQKASSCVDNFGGDVQKHSLGQQPCQCERGRNTDFLGFHQCPSPDKSFPFRS